MAAKVPKPVYDAVVVGAGGAGIATVGALLHFHHHAKISWIDASFEAGRLGARYRDVSSNTKTALFRQYADAFAPFQQIVVAASAAKKPNAITRLEQLEQRKGCQLGYAADVLNLLTDGLLRVPNVVARTGTLVRADFDSEKAVWATQDQGKDGETGEWNQARNLVLCTGSFPTTMKLPASRPKTLDLDDALDRTRLRNILLPASLKEPLTVGVIGTSHSAIVAIMNLYELSGAGAPLKIKWFVRSPLLYAVDMPDGWILRDNTGLKGASADFARQHLEDAALAISPVGKLLTKVPCPDACDESMKDDLDSCSHIVQAIGYTRSPTPQLSIDGKDVGLVDYDPIEGSLRGAKDGTAIPRAFGAGIAFPERTTDPHGNVESAVGLWKFVKYLKRVAPGWC